MQKILIDESLSRSLAADAQQKGFLCSDVNYLGKTGTKDWELKQVIQVVVALKSWLAAYEACCG